MDPESEDNPDAGIQPKENLYGNALEPNTEAIKSAPLDFGDALEEHHAARESLQNDEGEDDIEQQIADDPIEIDDDLSPDVAPESIEEAPDSGVTEAIETAGAFLKANDGYLDTQTAQEEGSDARQATDAGTEVLGVAEAHPEEESSHSGSVPIADPKANEVFEIEAPAAASHIEEDTPEGQSGEESHQHDLDPAEPNLETFSRVVEETGPADAAEEAGSNLELTEAETERSTDIFQPNANGADSYASLEAPNIGSTAEAHTQAGTAEVPSEDSSSKESALTAELPALTQSAADETPLSADSTVEESATAKDAETPPADVVPLYDVKDHPAINNLDIPMIDAVTEELQSRSLDTSQESQSLEIGLEGPPQLDPVSSLEVLQPSPSDPEGHETEPTKPGLPKPSAEGEDIGAHLPEHESVFNAAASALQTEPHDENSMAEGVVLNATPAEDNQNPDLYNSEDININIENEPRTDAANEHQLETPSDPPGELLSPVVGNDLNNHHTWPVRSPKIS